MAEDKHKRSIDSATKKWALFAAVCTSPLFIVFAYFDDPGRGQAAWVCAISITVAARFLWDLRARVWFWMTIAIIVLIHVPLIALIPWPDEQLSYVALLPAGFLDFLVAYGIIRLVESIIEKVRPSNHRA